MSETKMLREALHGVDPMFVDRWSPRALSEEPLADEELQALFEAARWAPSCMNEQPWCFVYARRPEDLERFRPVLVEGNRLWADRAPLLILLFSRKDFAATGKSNRHFGFDAGAAWMSLALQARKLGLYAHAMAGFSTEKAHEVAGVSEDWRAMAAIAVGRYGKVEDLPEDLREREHPSGRKGLAELAMEGRHVGP